MEEERVHVSFTGASTIFEKHELPTLQEQPIPNPANRTSLTRNLRVINNMVRVSRMQRGLCTSVAVLPPLYSRFGSSPLLDAVAQLRCRRLLSGVTLKMVATGAHHPTTELVCAVHTRQEVPPCYVAIGQRARHAVCKRQPLHSRRPPDFSSSALTGPGGVCLTAGTVYTQHIDTSQRFSMGVFDCTAYLAILGPSSSYCAFVQHTR